MRIPRALRARRVSRAAIPFVALLLLAWRPATAQGTCTLIGQNTCAVGGNATYGITVTVTVASRLTIPSTVVALAGPTSGSFDAGVGVAVSVPISVWSNTGWALTVRATNATWTAVPGTARQNKPAADLQWALAPGGPFVAMTTTSATVQSGVAVGGGVVSLHLRALYQWTLDRPGAYELPLQLTITAP